MKLLKKPLFAVLLSGVIVLGSTLLNTNVKFGKEVRAVENGFYDGVYYDGYTHKSIYSQLDVFLGAAGGLASIAENVGLDASSVSDACNTLRLVMKQGDIDDMGDAYADLASETNFLLGKLTAAGLEGRYSDGVDAYGSTLNGAMSVIENSGYNESVRQFCLDNDHFPMDILAALAGVELPELF